MAMMQPLASNARTTNVLESFRGGKMKFQTNLALALIEVAKPHLNVLERNYVFVTTGADGTFAAIPLAQTDCCQRDPAVAQSGTTVCNMARLVRLS